MNLTPQEQLVFDALSKVNPDSIIGAGIKSALEQKDKEAFMKAQIELLQQAVISPRDMKRSLGEDCFKKLMSGLKVERN